MYVVVGFAVIEEEESVMKSAYELALERLEKQGIERPREDSVSDSERAEMKEIRSRAEAKTAELEILHRGRLAKIHDLAGREQEEQEYRRERQRIEEARDRKLEALRAKRHA